MALVGQRDSFFDGLKFVLITLVVLGHSIGPVSTIYPLSVIYDFIYFFHMPLFIFVSGYFTKKKDDLQSFWQSTLRLVETLLVFHALSKFRFWITGGLSLSSLLTPAWGLWYLLCLIYWRFIIQFTPDKILSHKKLVLCVSVLLSVLIVSVRFGWSILSYQRFFGLLPFFMAGYYARQTDIVDKIKKINPAICVFVLSGIVIALILSGNRIDVLLQHAAYFNNKDYYDMNDTFMRMQLRILMLVIATVMPVCVINVCRYVPDKWKSFGQDTILFYVYHLLMLQFLRLPFVCAGTPFLTTVGGYFMSFVVVMIALFVADRFKIFHLLINPFTNLYKYLTSKK